MKRIYVNRIHIAKNRKAGNTRLPVFTCRDGWRIKLRSNGMELLDDKGEVVARLVYQPDKPLGCGAVAWVETNLQVRSIS